MMVAIRTGNATPEKRKGRTLSVSDPLVTAAVAAIAIKDFNVGETTRWGNCLAADARRWLSRGGFQEHSRRLSKRDAGQALKFALAQLAESEVAA